MTDHVVLLDVWLQCSTCMHANNRHAQALLQVVLLAMPGTDVDAIQSAVESQCAALPRGEVAAQALTHSCVVRVSSKQQAAELSNLYAPEHLIINTEDAESWLDLLDNAGSIFLGRWTPESVGDYASGTNHVRGWLWLLRVDHLHTTVATDAADVWLRTHVQRRVS